MLTGKSVEELKEACWKHKSQVFDPCNFIWNNYSQLGYRTAYAEDAVAIASFNNHKPGFRQPPTDYYYKALM